MRFGGGGLKWIVFDSSDDVVLVEVAVELVWEELVSKGSQLVFWKDFFKRVFDPKK